MQLPASLARFRTHVGRDLFWLMAACTAVHLVFLVTVGGFKSPAAARLYDDWLALSLPNLLNGRLWTLLTYGLVHDLQGISHILFNMLGVYFFGLPFARYAGRRQFWQLVIAATVVGGLLQVAIGALLGDIGIIVGCSALTMGLLTVFAMQQPEADVYLFFAIRLKAKFLVPIVVALDVLGALSGSDVAIFAHFGGLACGFMAALGWNWRVGRARILSMLGRRPTAHRPFTVIDGAGGKPKWPSWRDDPPS